MRKRVASLLILLVVVSLTACAAKGATPTPKPAEPPAEEETLSLRMWAHQNEAFNLGYEALIEAYEQAHPNIDITLETFEYDTYIQTLATAMPAGEEADILQLFGTWTSEYAERLLSVPEDVMTVSQAKELFYSAPIGGFVVEGKLYGLPQEFNCEYGGVLVNKSMFEKAGVAYPPEWKTMDDVLTNAKALVQTDDAGLMTVAGFHFTSSDPTVFSFLAGIKQRGGDYWNADHSGFTFNTPQAKATLEWMLKAVEEWGVVDPVLFNDEQNWVGDAFFEGRAAIGYIGTWAIAEGRVGYPDFEDEWDYFWLPPIQGDPVFVADSGWGLVVSPNSEHPTAAWEFAKFVTTDPGNAIEWNLASGTIPAMPEVAKAPKIGEEMPWVAKALEILPYGSYLGSMPDRDLVVYEIVYPHVLNALQGLETVDEALQMMDDEANATFQ